jgi:hypothetical protein
MAKQCMDSAARGPCRIIGVTLSLSLSLSLLNKKQSVPHEAFLVVPTSPRVHVRKGHRERLWVEGVVAHANLFLDVEAICRKLFPKCREGLLLLGGRNLIHQHPQARFPEVSTNGRCPCIYCMFPWGRCLKEVTTLAELLEKQRPPSIHMPTVTSRECKGNGSLREIWPINGRA